MSWNLVQLSEVAASLWRNGGGVTRELVVWPKGTPEWTWRMSVAQISQNGPFSTFEGMQRWFAVLGGEGVTLDVAGGVRRLTCESEPFEFDGASPVQCQLIDGATQDFNLMVRRAEASTKMLRVRGSLEQVLTAPKTVAIYAISTRARVQFDHDVLELKPHSLAWQAVPAGTSTQIESLDALWMEIDA